MALKYLDERQQSEIIPGILPFRFPAPDWASQVSTAWLRCHALLQTADVAELVGVSRPTAQSALDQLVDAGRLIKVGAGRSAGYRSQASTDENGALNHVFTCPERD